MVYIDCDSHILPVDAFDEVGEEFWNQKPRLVSDHKGYSFVSYEARQRNIPDYARPIPSPFTPRPIDLKKNDPAVRVADMSDAGFDIQVLGPRNGPFYYDVEPRLAASVCQSYNNTISRIVRQYPKRFLGLATLPLQDVDLAVRELERCIGDLGLHAPVVYTSIQDKDLDSRDIWPFYSKAQELNVPLIIHPVNTGPIVGGWRLTRHYAAKGYGLWSALGNVMENSLTFAEMLFGGVLDAFPALRLCFMEGGGTQVPHLIDSLDAVYQGEGDYERFTAKPKRRPVEYLDRVYFGVRPTETLLGVLVERYGSQSWVVGSDYPHGDTMGSWPNTISVVKAREDLSARAKEDILGGNAARLFGLKGL
jgi:aminocarboxymuconate-semialdehyde decarboxylase